MNTRVVYQGNVKESGFDIRIIEANNKSYYYHILQLDDGECIISSLQPFNLKGETEISWDDLSIKVRKAHYDMVYPNGATSGYEMNCFLFGKQKADEEKVALERLHAQEQEEKRQIEEKLRNLPIDFWRAQQIYNEIGPYTTVTILCNKWPIEKYIVDEKTIITIKSGKVISVQDRTEYENEQKNWGKRVSKIAEIAGTNYNISTIVGDITDIDDAVQTLKEVLNILNEDKFIEHFHQQNLGYLIFGEEIPTCKIKDFFENQLEWKLFKKLKFNKRFYEEIQRILKNKK